MQKRSTPKSIEQPFSVSLNRQRVFIPGNSPRDPPIAADTTVVWHGVTLSYAEHSPAPTKPLVATPRSPSAQRRRISGVPRDRLYTVINTGRSKGGKVPTADRFRSVLISRCKPSLLHRGTLNSSRQIYFTTKSRKKHTNGLKSLFCSVLSISNLNVQKIFYPYSR